jgi:hypothetical protein
MSVLATMNGEAVLNIVRDCVANEAARIRTLEDNLVKVGASSRIAPDRLAVVLALNAAVDIVTLAIAEGQDKRERFDNDEQRAKDRARKALVKLMADQARAALMRDGFDPKAEERNVDAAE